MLTCKYFHILRRAFNTALAILVFLSLGMPVHASDGVLEINQAAAEAGGIIPGDGAGFPVSISDPGSYILTGNLTVDSDVTALAINSPDVTVDFNGFSISSTATSSGNGVLIESTSHNAAIRNGTIRGFPGHGVFVSGGAMYVQVKDIRVLSNGMDGILTQAVGSTVQGCTVAQNGGLGIRGFAGSLILDNVIYNNAEEGLVMNSSAYGSNILYDNNGGNANPQVNQSFAVQLTGNQCGNSACP